MSAPHSPNRLGECEVSAASTALVALLGASCYAPTLSHDERMAAYRAIMRVIGFSSREITRRKRRANMQRLARNQAYDAYLAERWAAEQLGAALDADRVADFLHGGRDLAPEC
ncbi:MAG: hypothetical protein U0232_13490 [Thermomicrobiales bacterium]